MATLPTTTVSPISDGATANAALWNTRYTEIDGNFAYLAQRLLYCGIETSNGSTPVTYDITVDTSDVDDYMVFSFFQDASNKNGELQVTKTIVGTTLTVSFINTGSATGNKFAFVVLRAF
jgi:hypothetical protein